MSIKRPPLIRAAAAVAIAASVLSMAAPQAEARIRWSNPVSWDGATLKARLGLPYFADMNGCGNWDSLANITRSPRWLENHTSFTAYGIGATLTVSGVGVTVGGTPSYKTLALRNTKGQLNTYLAGNVCMNWSTIYLGMNVSGTAMYNGQVRSTNVGV